MRNQDLFDRFLQGKKNSLGQAPSILEEILGHQITIDDVYNLFAEEHPIFFCESCKPNETITERGCKGYKTLH